jgi:hypothetical protein
MNIKYRAMTLQTCDHHAKPKLVYGIPNFQFTKPNGTFGNKKEGTEQQIVVHLTSFQKCVCSKENYKYRLNEIHYSRGSHLINRETLEVSVNGSLFEKVSFENCLNEKYVALEGSQHII